MRTDAFDIASTALELGDDAPAEILLVSQYYWPEEIGSAPYMTDIAEWFARRRHRVTALTSRPHYPEFRVRPGYERGQQDDTSVNGVHIRRLATYAPRGGRAALRIVADGLMMLRQLREILLGRVARSHLVISLCPSILSVLVGTVAKRRGGRHVAIIHDIQSGIADGLGMVGSGGLVRAMRWVERVILNRADRVIVLSPQMRDVLRQNGVRAPIDVLPIWTDPERVFPIDRPRDERRPTVLYSGNFGRKQGLSQILDMAAVIQQMAPEARVVLRGAGSQHDDLRRAVDERRLENVEFAPLSPPDKLNDGLNDADLHVVPQDPTAADYALPSKVYAIMSAAQPFVCTACPGTALWTLQRETGAFVCTPPGEPEAMAEAVLRLLRSAEERHRLGQAGRAWVLQHASREKVLSRLNNLLCDGMPEATTQYQPHPTRP